MRFFCLLTLLAAASAFTTQSRSVGGFSKNVVADNSAHRNRRATIVMDGKANGESCRARGTINQQHPSHNKHQ